jgi:hypothetical protein
VKTALKLLLWYVIACFATELLSIIFAPPHAHAPVLILLGLSPLLPVLIPRSMIEHGVTVKDVLMLGLFFVLFCGLSYRTLRRPR